MHRLLVPVLLWSAASLCGCSFARHFHAPEELVGPPAVASRSDAPSFPIVAESSSPRINIELDDADIRIVLDLIAKQSGMNIVVHEGVTGSVSLSLRDTDCREALRLVVRTAGYHLVEPSGILNVYLVVTEPMEPSPTLDTERAHGSIPGKVYEGPRVNLEFENTDIKNALDLIAKSTGLNIVVAEDVEATVSASLRNVPGPDALRIIVEEAGYELLDTESGIYRVVPRS